MHQNCAQDGAGQLAARQPLAMRGASSALFSPAVIMDLAAREAGVGDPAILDTPGLHALCGALEAAEPDFNFIGRRRAQRMLIETLVKRLRVAHHLERHPEIREIPIRSPIFLVAPFRSGTTLLHRLLAQDPAHRAPRLWEALQAPPAEPLYRGDERYFDQDYRVPIARKYMDTRERMSGDIAVMHPSGADLPEECFGLIETSLISHSFMFYGPVTEYLDWLDTLDEEVWREAYELYADQLRLLQWWYPGERWVLKTPFHMWAVEAVRAVFPDALIVQQHRSPATCTASFCSLTAAAYGPIVSQVDKGAIGAMALRYLRDATTRNAEARKRLGPDGFIDVDYHELVSDPVACAGRIYEALDLPFSDEVERKMRHWLLVQAATRKKEKHKYRLEEYGLEQAEVDSAFAAYEAFNHPIEMR